MNKIMIHRPLNVVKAISFDLDDTLYDNSPVLMRAETEMLSALASRNPFFASETVESLRQFRQQLARKNPELLHDVTFWREQALIEKMSEIGISILTAQALAQYAIDVFLSWRSEIDVPANTHITLQKLATKFPLIAITNGNVSVEKCGLADYFQFVLKSGADGRAKPAVDMFEKAQSMLNLPAQNILHVGDDSVTDVQGALINGFMACWLNNNPNNETEQRSLTEANLLPHIEIFDLALLQQLL